MSDDPDLTITLPGDGDCEMAVSLDDGNSIVIHGMNQSWANANARSLEAHNTMLQNIQYSYLANKDNMSNTQALAHRTAVEAGAGRTRVESNTPASTQTVDKTGE